MDNFLDYYHIVDSFSPMDKGGLEWRNQIWKKRPNPSNNDLGDDFVNRVTQADRAVMTEGFQVTTFQDQGDDNFVEVLGNPTRGKNLLHFNPD